MKRQGDLRSVLSLLPYLSVLLEQYPNPVRAVELARRTARTKAAVTKVRERLLEACDANEMAFERGFRLSATFDVFVTLLVAYAANGKQREYLSSKFASSFLKSDKIHSMLVSTFPKYDQYFNRGETNFLIDKILEILSNIEPHVLKQLAKAIVRSSKEEMEFAFVKVLSIISSDLRFSIRDERELSLAFSVRDKLFFLIRDFLWTMIESLDILGAVGQDKRSYYLEVYKHTIDHYLRRIFESLSEPIINAAKISSVKVDAKASNIGSSLLRSYAN